MENIHEMNLVELNNKEQKIVGGGGFGGLALGLLGAAIYDCIANHEQFVQGVKEGYADTSQ